MLKRVKLTVLSGITPQQFNSKIKLFIAQVDVEIGNIAFDTKFRFHDVISSHRRRGPSRSGNRMAKSIKVHEKDLGIIKIAGVGDTNVMNAEAPYWKVVNYGGIVPPAAVGWFGDGNPPDSSMAGQGREPWHNVQGALGGSSFGGGVWMKPKNPIRPMNFIQTTINMTINRWAGYWVFKLERMWNALKAPPPLTK